MEDEVWNNQCRSYLKVDRDNFIPNSKKSEENYQLKEKIDKNKLDFGISNNEDSSDENETPPVSIPVTRKQTMRKCI